MRFRKIPLWLNINVDSTNVSPQRFFMFVEDWKNVHCKSWLSLSASISS